MNKEQIIKYLKNSIDEKGNYCYSLPMETTKAIIKYIDQLTNNWNELRHHIKDYLEEWENNDDEWVKGKCDMARDILYDMEEIKEGNNESK